MAEEIKMDALVERMDLADLTLEQIEPLERLMQKEWSDTWRELARSHYVTLVSAGGRPLDDCAELAVRLMLGVALDMGGEQHYIQAGAHLLQNRRAQRVMELLQAGHGYQDVARKTGLTEPGVRSIERRWRRARRAAEAERVAEFERRQLGLAI